MWASITLSTTHTSFNRYMVECEYQRLTEIEKRGLCFNRYMVECESMY